MPHGAVKADDVPAPDFCTEFLQADHRRGAVQNSYRPCENYFGEVTVIDGLAVI